MARLVPSIGKIILEAENTPVYIKALTKKDNTKVEIEGILLKGGDNPVGYFRVRTMDGQLIASYKADEFAVEYESSKGMISEEKPFEIGDIFTYEDIAVEMVDTYGGKVVI